MSNYEGKNLVQALVDRAMQDDAFRGQLLSDPAAVIEKETGRKLPAGVQIKAVEDTPNTVHIVVPAKTSGSRELGDAELENVAGGVAFQGPLIRTGPSPFSIKAGPGTRADWGIGGTGFLHTGSAVINPV